MFQSYWDNVNFNTTLSKSMKKFLIKSLVISRSQLILHDLKLKIFKSGFENIYFSVVKFLIYSFSKRILYCFLPSDKFTGPFGPNSRFIDDQQPNSRQFSPSHNNTNSSSNNNDESTCSSTFHIDSPPSTAEFSQYFHAGSSSSAYFRNAIETGFAQLTLTDDEQRELYEAALVIQNAYRRYIQRKKKKIRLDESLLPPSDADSSDAITAKDDTVNVNTSPETAALILGSTLVYNIFFIK